MNHIHIRLVRLSSDIESTCLMHHHMEELADIAQTLIHINVHNSFALEDALYRFHQEWEIYGLSRETFMMLYEMCMSIVLLGMCLPLQKV